MRVSRRMSLASAAQLSPQWPFPGIPALQPFSAKQKPTCETTTLANGLRVVSQETYRTNTSLGLFVDAGSRLETAQNNGVSHLLEHLAFKSTQARSHQRLVRDVEDMGAQVGAASAREYFVYTADVLRTNVDGAVALLSETALQPKFSAWEIDEQRKVIGYETHEMEKNAQQMVTEMIFEAAYGPESGLGRSLYMPKRNLNKIGQTEVEAFFNAHFTDPKRMVLAAAGIQHQDLVELAKRYFAKAQASAASAPTMTKPQTNPYLGGEKRMIADSPLTQVSLAFNVGGWSSPNLLPVCVVHMLLGGGSSFSPGGPGKGMYSRLYTNVLNKHWWCESATAFNSIHNGDAGLLGMYGTCEPQNAGKLISVLADELVQLASKEPNQEETARAKNQLKSSIVMNLDTTQILMEDIGRQTLVFGQRQDPAELCAKIDQVTPAQLQKVAQDMLKTKLTFTAFGDVSAVPSYGDIAKLFK